MDSKYKGRIVETYSYSTPGAWDNYALPEYGYYGVALTEEGKLEQISLGHSDQGPLPAADATPEVLEVYEKMKAAARAARDAEKKEKERNAPAYGKTMEVLKGKNKGFVGVVKWVGSTKFGDSALLINDKGEKVFTKPHNLKLIAEAPIEPEISVGSKVKVKMGKNAGRAGTVEWMGETKYGYKAKVKTSEGDVWANPKNLEMSDESEVKAMIA